MAMKLKLFFILQTRRRSKTVPWLPFVVQISSKNILGIFQERNAGKHKCSVNENQQYRAKTGKELG